MFSTHTYELAGGSWHSLKFPSYTMPPLIISAAIGLIYVADRTGFWGKEQKQFDAWSFGILCLTSLGIGLTTIKRTDSDQGILNREQTEEWKGWMQSKFPYRLIYFKI